MSPDDPGRPDLRKSNRLPLQRQVRLDFEDFRGFISEYSKNISTGGMFIESDSPREPGEIFLFEFRLADGYQLIRGRGQVVWKSEAKEGSDRPAGMGIRFVEIDEAGRQLILRVTEEFSKSGGRRIDYLHDETGVPTKLKDTEEDAAEVESTWEGAEPVAAAPTAPPAAEGFDVVPLEEPQLASAPLPDVAAHVSPEALHPIQGSTVKRRGHGRLVGGLLAIGLLAVALLLYLYRDRIRDALQETDQPAEQTAEPVGVEAASQDRPTVSGGDSEGEAPEEAVSSEKGSFSGLERIDWHRESGGLMVELTVDGVVRSGDYGLVRLEDTAPPRLLLRLRGVSRAFPKPTLSVRTPEVRQIRTGYHSGPAGDEQHVVFDLSSERVELVGVEDGGAVLRLHFRTSS